MSLAPLKIYLQVQKITSIKESIIVNSEKLRTNFKLIKLDDSAPLPFTMNEIEYVFTEITTKEVLKGIGLIKH